MNDVPLFPLNTVLFPDGILPLRIFEPRYLDMVSECLKGAKAFGVVLIRNGEETGTAASTCEIGTLATIVDFQKNDDGLLGIVVSGGRRFRIIDRHVDTNQLLRGTLEILDHNDDPGFPAQYELLARMLRQILEKFGLDYMDQHERFEEPYWVGSRLAELLPIGLNERQRLLEMDDPIARLDHLQNTIAHMDLDQ